jgi:hypothetical protein
MPSPAPKSLKFDSSPSGEKRDGGGGNSPRVSAEMKKKASSPVVLLRDDEAVQKRQEKKKVSPLLPSDDESVQEEQKKKQAVVEVVIQDQNKVRDDTQEKKRASVEDLINVEKNEVEKKTEEKRVELPAAQNGSQEAVIEEGQEEEASAEEEHCPDCTRLLGDLKNHTAQDHAVPIAMQKAAIKAWFECHYTTSSDEVGEGAKSVPRKTLLAEINVFLDHMGWPNWKAQSSMYKDWFLVEVLKVGGADATKGRPWSLYARDGFAHGGDDGGGRRNKEQRLAEMMEKIRGFL